MKQLITQWLSVPLTDRVVIVAVASLIANLMYAFYHGGLGLTRQSSWLIANGLYYGLLAVTRFIALFYVRRRRLSTGFCVAVALLLFALSGLLGALLTHSLRQSVATVYGTVPMITIATVTFTKIGIATTSAVRHRGRLSLSHRTINAIRYAEIAISLCTMQRSMLASFGDASDPSATILNRCTGIGVCLFVISLGIYLIYISRKEAKTHGNISSYKSC